MLTTQKIASLVLWAGLIGMSLFAQATPSDARKEIESVYATAARGARLKFVHGMLSHRAADFETFGADGRKLDLTVERGGFKSLFAPATQVDLTTRVISFRAQGNQAVCQVEQLLSIEAPEPETRQRITILLNSCSKDSWVCQGNRWKLQTRRIITYESRTTQGGGLNQK